MMLDVFRGDAFHTMPLSQAFNLLPYAPTYLGELGLFQPMPVASLSVAIERQAGKLTLVAAAARGAPGAIKGLERRDVRDVRLTHLPQRYMVMADEVANLRAFGSSTELETVQGLLNQKRQVVMTDLSLTHEWQRMGALRGQVLDADGTTVLYDWFNEFGVTQTTHTMTFSSATFPVLQNVIQAKRKGEEKLGGIMNTGGWLVLCSASFFDAFTAHKEVKEAFKDYGSNSMNRDDKRDGFIFGSNVTWREYRGTVNGVDFIPADKAIMIPMGVPGLCTTYFGPAPYLETVNTMGLPFYEKMSTLDWDVGVEFQVQSNPLHMVNRPDAIIELTAA